MHKIKIFIDYPVSSDKEFKGLSFPQVLFDFLKTSKDAEAVGEKDKFDILFVISGGSHYSDHSLTGIIRKLFAEKHTYSESNIDYERRLAELIRKNPKARVVHRLDDRYRMLCKVYGYDKTVSWINKKADATVFHQLGIPVISDFMPTSFHILDNFKCGYLAHSKGGWLSALEKLSKSAELRQEIAQNALKEFNRLYNPLDWSKRLHQDIEKLWLEKNNNG